MKTPQDTTPRSSLPFRVSDPIAYFRGEWRFERKLQSGSTEGKAGGTASFLPEGDGLRWKETGQLEFGQASTSTSRELTIEPSGSGWVVRFDDGRPFHRLDLEPGSCAVAHPCRDDLYRGRIAVEDQDNFRTTWRVEGPAKDQLIETVYRRVEKPKLD